MTPSAAFPLQLTDSAKDRIADVCAHERMAALRVYVQGGGCAGFSYKFALEPSAAEDDLILEEDGFMVVVDPFSAPMLDGATVDWVEDLMNRHFEVRNPNATATCGCGSSFSI